MNRRTFFNWISLSWLISIFYNFINAIFISKAKPQIAVFHNTPPNEDTLIFYVAPNGNDVWSGRLANPNKLKTDGPLATIHQARNVIRELKRQQNYILKQSIVVLIRGGTYLITESLVFTPEDSGTEEFPITYKAYSGEKPIISGGQSISHWQKEKVNGHEVWTAIISEVESSQSYCRQLWVNGERRYRARKPKNGCFLVESSPDVTATTPWNQGQKRFQYFAGDITNWATIQNAEVILMNYWSESHLPVVSVDESQRVINFSKPSLFRIESGKKFGNSRATYYYIENCLEILDSPGEWYLNQHTGKLYYYPYPYENMDNLEIIVPVISQLIKIDGSESEYVENIHFERITFAYTDWYLSENFKDNRWGFTSGFGQAAHGIPGAIYASKTRCCVWRNCTIKHIGNYGLELTKNSHDNTVINCEIFDLAAGSIKLMVSTHNNQIINCHVYDGGLIFHGAVGIYIQSGTFSNRIAYCHLHDFYYSGISLGWQWGYDQPFLTEKNIIEFNDIHHIGRLSHNKTPMQGPILNDKGGIYTLGVQPLTTIRFNTIHNIDAYNYGAWGIYLDEGSSEILIQNNIVYNTKNGSFHLHYGRDNIVLNNIFAFGRHAQMRYSRPEDHLSFIFERNIVYWSASELLEGNWDNFNFEIDNNLYWRIDESEIQFSKLSWDEWRKKGMDKNSVIGDPLFLNPETGDFRLQSNSPAFKIGFFNPISIENILPE